MLRPRISQTIYFLLIAAGLAFGQIVNPVVSTSPTDGNADDPAIWIHPTDPTRSVIIGTDKDAGIFVWNMNGEQLQHIDQGTTCNNVDVRYRMQLGGQLVDIVATNLRDAGKLAVFKVNPNYTNGDVFIQIADRNSANNDIQGNSYGFALYRRPSDGSLYVFERPESGGAVRQYRIQDDGTGNGITLTAVRDLNYNGGDGLGTDGLDVTSSAAANFPQGFVVVHDEGGSRFHLYDWTDFAQSDLTICVNGSPTTSVEDDNPRFLPTQFELAQNYPNPFNPSTTIFYRVPKAIEVRLSIYNIRGQQVRTLVSGAVAAGRHQVVWDGTDEKNARVASGLYIYRMEAPGFVSNKKLILTK